MYWTSTIRITARPDPTELGYAFTAIIAFDIDNGNLQPALEALNNRPDIHWLAAVSGRFDVMATIWASSTDELFKQLDEIGKIEGIKNIEQEKLKPDLSNMEMLDQYMW